MDRLQWHEPAAYRRGLFRDEARRNPWSDVKRVAGCFAVIFALRGLVELAHLHNGQFPNRPGWLFSVAVAAGLGFVVGYLLPRIILFLPGSLVILSEKGVNNNTVGTHVKVRFWPWTRIDHAHVSLQTVRGREFTVLSLYDESGDELATFALRDRPAVAEIQAFFQNQGKTIELM